MLEILSKVRKVIAIYKIKCNTLFFTILILLVPGISHGSQMGFCFHRSVSLSKVQSEVRPFLIDGEKLHVRSSLHCLEGNLRSSRANFLRKFFSRKYALTKTYGTEGDIDVNAARSMCRIQLIEQGGGISKTRSVNVGRNSKARDSETKNSGEKITRLTLSSGLPGKISINGKQVTVICHKKRSGLHQIELTRVGPDGSVSTSFYAQKGQRLNIGSFSDNGQGSQRKIGTKSGLSYSSSQGKSNKTYYILVQ